MKLNHINTALFSLANLHKPCRRYIIFPYFSLVFSWCSWRHGESSSACIHHYDTTSSSHHLRSPAPLLFLLSKIIISSSNIGFILIQHLREHGAFLSTRDLRMPATICVSNDHLESRWGEWSFDALWLWLLHRQVKKSGFVSTSSWFDHVRPTLLAIVPYPLASSF